jgi:hypothetical protein
MKKLLSIGFLTNKGFKLEFHRKCCNIRNFMGQRVATAVRNSKNGLYKLQGETLNGCTEVAISFEVNAVTLNRQSMSSASLLHQRLGNFHSHGIRCMITHGALKGLPKI